MNKKREGSETLAPAKVESVPSLRSAMVKHTSSVTYQIKVA
jgi:hypothetical protein